MLQYLLISTIYVLLVMILRCPPDRDVQLHGPVPGPVGVAGAGEAHLPAALGAHLHVRPHPRQHRLRGPEHPPGRHPGPGDRSPGEVRPTQLESS